METVVVVDVRQRQQRQCRAEAEDNGDGGRLQLTVAQWRWQWRQMMGGLIINPLLLWFNDKILIPTYFYSIPCRKSHNLLATC